jgi:hypothetical protein
MIISHAERGPAMVKLIVMILFFAGRISSATSVPDSQAIECASTLFHSSRAAADAGVGRIAKGLSVERLGGYPWTKLPFPVYRFESLLRRPAPTGWFAAGQGACSLLRGDLNEFLGLDGGFEAERAYALTQFNSVVQRSSHTVNVNNDPAAIDYSVAVLTLVSPSLMRLISDYRDIPGASTSKGRPEMSAGAPEVNRVTVQAPRVRRGIGIVQVQLDSWDQIGGIVWRNTVMVFSDGRVSLTRDEIASGVGEFKAFQERLLARERL